MQPADFVRFSDTRRNTSFAAQVDAAALYAGVFNFVTPTGAQYLGGQASDLHQQDEGRFEVQYDGPVQFRGPASDGQEADNTTVTVHLNAAIDLQEQRATAEIRDDTNGQQYVMITRVPGGELEAVEAYHQAMLQQDWPALYRIVTHMVTNVYTEAQFSQLMAQQTPLAGTVTAFSITSEPQVTVDTIAGMTTFTITEQATIIREGISQTYSFTCLFILEDGTWKVLSSGQNDR